VNAVISVIKNRPVGRPKTKITLKRCILLNGKPVGRGRPCLKGINERTVIRIPIDETYNVKKHGLGMKFYAGLKQFKQSIKRIDIAKFVNNP